MGAMKDAVTLQIQMASLPGGTLRTSRRFLTPSAKQLVVTRPIPITRKSAGTKGGARANLREECKLARESGA